jgi:ParB-like chromosome segregation protein Spo0J
MEELEVHTIHPPKYSLRSDLGQLDGLMASIEEKGLLEPIILIFLKSRRRQKI